MDLLDGGFGVELELVPDATELVLHRVVVPARQRLLHGSAPELVRDKREPVLSVWHGLRRDHPETVPIAFLELSLKSAGFLAHPTNRVCTRPGQEAVPASVRGVRTVRPVSRLGVGIRRALHGPSTTPAGLALAILLRHLHPQQQQPSCNQVQLNKPIAGFNVLLPGSDHPLHQKTRRPHHRLNRARSIHSPRPPPTKQNNALI